MSVFQRITTADEGMDGIQTMKKIKSEYKIPVIAVTAYAMESEQARLLNEGFDDYISKPVDINILWGKIGELLQRPV